MSNPTLGSSAARTLPARPNLEHLKNEAKARLAALRATMPDARLADAQFQLAREYGFASWRELKADLDRRTGAADPVGDWIGAIGPDSRIAVHLRRDPDGTLQATLDIRDVGHFDIPAVDVSCDGAHLTFALLDHRGDGLYEGRWDAAAGQWVGEWMSQGVRIGLDLARGVWPPAPAVPGLDGVWSGQIETEGHPRLIFRVRTDRHGTFAWCDSPDRNGFGFPVRVITREGQTVTFAMQTLSVSGELDAEGRRIEGRFVKGKTSLPIALVRRAPGEASTRGPKPPVVEVAAEVLAAYVGQYAYAPDRRMTVSLEDGRLFAQYPGQPKLALSTSGPAEVFWEALDATGRFEVAADGAVTAFVVHSQGRDSRAERVG